MLKHTIASLALITMLAPLVASAQSKTDYAASIANDYFSVYSKMATIVHADGGDCAKIDKDLTALGTTTKAEHARIAELITKAKSDKELADAMKKATMKKAEGMDQAALKEMRGLRTACKGTPVMATVDNVLPKM